MFGGIENRYSGRANVRLARAGLVVLVLFLAACSDQNMGDLQNYVSDVKSKRGKIEPLPEFEPVQQFTYSADDMKDPFMTWKSEVVPVGKHKEGDLMPDAQRPREELESYPLDTLRMMGILEMKGERWGLVKASDGIVYRVRTGNYMGQNFGKITAIEPDRIALVEIVPNGLGGWERREASLTLNTE